MAKKLIAAGKLKGSKAKKPAVTGFIVPTLLVLFMRNLAKLRHAAGLSQAQLAARAGLTSGYVWCLEHGLREPSFTVIEALGKAMGVQDPRTFFEGKP